jgi:hypothetical protein
LITSPGEDGSGLAESTAAASGVASPSTPVSPPRSSGAGDAGSGAADSAAGGAASGADSLGDAKGEDVDAGAVLGGTAATQLPSSRRDTLEGRLQPTVFSLISQRIGEWRL